MKCYAECGQEGLHEVYGLWLCDECYAQHITRNRQVLESLGVSK